MRIKLRERLIYSILKEIENNNCSITESDFETDKEVFWQVSEIINNNGFVKNISFTFGNNVSYAAASITLEGMDYLKENSKLAKTYRGIKEIRDWLKFG